MVQGGSLRRRGAGDMPGVLRRISAVTVKENGKGGRETSGAVGDTAHNNPARPQPTQTHTTTRSRHRGSGQWNLGRSLDHARSSIMVCDDVDDVLLRVSRVYQFRRQRGTAAPASASATATQGAPPERTEPKSTTHQRIATRTRTKGTTTARRCQGAVCCSAPAPLPRPPVGRWRWPCLCPAPARRKRRRRGNREPRSLAAFVNVLVPVLVCVLRCF